MVLNDSNETHYPRPRTTRSTGDSVCVQTGIKPTQTRLSRLLYQDNPQPNPFPRESTSNVLARTPKTFWQQWYKQWMSELPSIIKQSYRVSVHQTRSSSLSPGRIQEGVRYCYARSPQVLRNPNYTTPPTERHALTTPILFDTYPHHPRALNGARCKCTPNKDSVYIHTAVAMNRTHPPTGKISTVLKYGYRLYDTSHK